MKKYGINSVVGDMDLLHSCGSEHYHYTVVSAKQVEENPGSLVEPMGTFHEAEAGVLLELTPTKKVVGVKIIHNPAQQTCVYDQHLFVPKSGNTLRYVGLKNWVRVWNGSKANAAVRATCWANVRKEGVRAANNSAHGGIENAAIAAVTAMERESEKYPTVVQVKLTSDDLHVD